MKTIVQKHFDEVSKSYDSGKRRHSYYYESLKKLLGSLIPESKKVFEVGCGTGDLLASLNPKKGYGTDISHQMINLSKSKYKSRKNLAFSTSWPSDQFDYIFMSDVIEHLENPEEMFKRISKLMGKKTIFINTMANPIWEPILMVAEKLDLKMPEGKHKRLMYEDLKILLEKSGMKVIKHSYHLLMPIYIPFVSDFMNRHFEKNFIRLAFIEFFTAKRGFSS